MVGCELCGSCENLMRCAKCKGVYYCSKDHQVLHWRVHKRICKKGEKQSKSRDQKKKQQLPPSSNHATCSFESTPDDHDHSTSQDSNNSIENSAWTAEDVNHRWSLHTTPVRVNGETEHDSGDSDSCSHPVTTSPESWESTESAASNSRQNHHRNHRHNHHHHPTAGALQTVKVDTAQSRNHRDGSLILNHEMANGGLGKLHAMCQNVIRDMNEYGICVIDDFAGEKVGNAVFQEVVTLYSSGRFRDGKLMNDMAGSSSHAIRGDKITWVDGREPACKNIGSLIQLVDAIVITSNKMANNGKLGQYVISDRTRAMVACYPGNGTQYVKHVDNPNKDGRCITCIYYLNKEWDVTKDGGLLRIFPKGCTTSVADIEPSFDRILLFWSDRRNPHEVQPAQRTRYAITLWYYDKYEKEAAMHLEEAAMNRRGQEVVDA